MISSVMGVLLASLGYFYSVRVGNLLWAWKGRPGEFHLRLLWAVTVWDFLLIGEWMLRLFKLWLQGFHRHHQMVVVSTATTNDWLALEAGFTGQKELRPFHRRPRIECIKLGP